MFKVLKLSGMVLGLLLAGFTQAEVKIDFSESTIFPTSAQDIQVNNIRLDTVIADPFDPTRPQIISVYYDVPFTFDMASLHFVPDLNRAGAGNETCAVVDVLVTNAFNGQPLAGAIVLIGGQSAITNDIGVANFTGLNGGTLSVEATASGFRPNTPRTVEVACGFPQQVSIALSPTEGMGALQANALRIILTWGENPEDVDSHLTGPQPGLAVSDSNDQDRFHVYYSNPASTDGVAMLDVDDTTSFGPETITVYPPTGQDTLRPGIYRYSVHHYSGSGTLVAGNANVELIIGANSRTFQAPTAGVLGRDDVWTVFELNVDANGAISVLPINQYTTPAYFGGEIRSGTRVPLQYEAAHFYPHAK